MAPLVGDPSDEIPRVLATGRTGITTFFISMSTRHPDGRDAEYLEWHSMDHRPEQYRLASIRGSLRIVSTPSCRAARAASSERYEAVDHVMTYMFTDPPDLDGFVELGAALNRAGRIPYLLPPVERSIFNLQGTVAAPRIKAGADVLPWWPMRGVYYLIEGVDQVDGGLSPAGLLDVPGVAGAWWLAGRDPGRADVGSDTAGVQVTYCFLDDDPAATGERLRPHLEARWEAAGVTPLLAAPFHVVINHEWDRYVP